MIRIPLPYSPDPTRLFAPLRALPGAAMLDSGRPACTLGRWDILVADPRCRLETRDGITTRIDRTGSRQVLATDPFTAVGDALDEFRPQAPGREEDIPFAGGALGYFGYDLGRTLEQLPALAEADLHVPQMQIGIYDWAVIVDHHRKQSWLVSHSLEARELRRIEHLLGQPPGDSAPFRLRSAFVSNMDRAAYGERFFRIRDYIAAGDCYQVNLAQRFSARCEGDPWTAYRALRTAAPTPFSAYMDLAEGALLSLSPERFIQVVDGRVETRPIKGTRPRHADAAEDARLAAELLASEKDRAENLMIVDLLRNDLGRTCRIGSVRVPELFRVEHYANVHHLVSVITGELSGPGELLPLLAGSFPGGSITGAPKIRAMEIIEELEPHRRGPYCGSIGYIDFSGRMDTNIAIRTLVCDRDRIHCWAGGGIVADSDCEAEYQETFAKVSNLLGPLAGTFGEKYS